MPRQTKQQQVLELVEAERKRRLEEVREIHQPVIRVREKTLARSRKIAEGVVRARIAKALPPNAAIGSRFEIKWTDEHHAYSQIILDTEATPVVRVGLARAVEAQEAMSAANRTANAQADALKRNIILHGLTPATLADVEQYIEAKVAYTVNITVTQPKPTKPKRAKGA